MFSCPVEDLYSNMDLVFKRTDAKKSGRKIYRNMPNDKNGHHKHCGKLKSLATSAQLKYICVAT
jgi:hypothetical protein